MTSRRSKFGSRKCERLRRRLRIVALLVLGFIHHVHRIEGCASGVGFVSIGSVIETHERRTLMRSVEVRSP